MNPLNASVCGLLLISQHVARSVVKRNAFADYIGSLSLMWETMFQTYPVVTILLNLGLMLLHLMRNVLLWHSLGCTSIEGRFSWSTCDPDARVESK